ncbi:MAG: hypothetical protein GW907_00265 [Betaproteobacteria bacterium]|nr:hypothetical protein [Betaproteobacteria bacterium]OIP21411.1 MAG: hypothetical protein AUK50_01500 [Comamonadaceae bacterium CG2_30_57_122]PIZ23882.1 MAG: hypothetical protein COY49_00970 [Comamonadaceae bacterium CG_4_10_14_0_8_um_filter_57_29]
MNTELTIEDKPSRTAVARAALAIKLGGMSPLEKGRERERKALEWIYRWGWASSTTLELLVDTKRSGLALRLIKNKLIISTDTEGITKKYVPGAYLTLTKQGHEQIEDELELGLDYSPNERPNLSNLKHDEIAQRRTASALVRGAISRYVTEKEMADKFREGIKNPDVLWIFPDGTKASIEVELTQKFGRDLDVFVRSNLISLLKKERDAHSPDFIYIITTNLTLKKNYEIAFAPGAPYFKWFKDKDKNRWVKEDKPGKVPENIKDKIMWEVMDK